MLINLKIHIQMQSKIMKKRQRKKNNKNVFIPLIPVKMTEEEVKQILKTREEQYSRTSRNCSSLDNSMGRATSNSLASWELPAFSISSTLFHSVPRSLKPSGALGGSRISEWTMPPFLV